MNVKNTLSLLPGDRLTIAMFGIEPGAPETPLLYAEAVFTGGWPLRIFFPPAARSWVGRVKVVIRDEYGGDIGEVGYPQVSFDHGQVVTMDIAITTPPSASG